jgi:hypothetical protein
MLIPETFDYVTFHDKKHFAARDIILSNSDCHKDEIKKAPMCGRQEG